MIEEHKYCKIEAAYVFVLKVLIVVTHRVIHKHCMEFISVFQEILEIQSKNVKKDTLTSCVKVGKNALSFLLLSSAFISTYSCV